MTLHWGGALLVAVVALLASCGGGGGGESGGGGASGATTFTADHVPLASGDRRRWRITSGEASGALKSESIGSAAQVSGYAAFEARDETGELEYLARTSSALVAIPGPNADPISAILGPVEMLRFGLGPGETAVLVDRTISDDFDGDRRADSVRIEVGFSVVGFESVSIALANYPQAARVRINSSITIALSSGASATATYSSDEWYVMGIGRVRAVITTQVSGQPAATQTEELTTYGVGALRSESVAPRVLSVTPNDGAATQPPSVIALQFSEPLDPSTLQGENGLRLLDAMGHPVLTQQQVAPDGSATNLVPVVALPEGQYSVRAGSGVVDWANNPVLNGQSRFVVDTTLPRLVSSTPTRDSSDFEFVGTVSLTFDEAVVAVSGEPVFLDITDSSGFTIVQRLPATLTASTLSATVTTPLVRNTVYQLRPAGRLSDRAGNLLDATGAQVVFRTDPGPLGRPVPLVPGSVVYGVRVGDLDGDGRNDLVFAGAQSSDLAPYLGLRPGLAAGGYGPAQRLLMLEGICEARELTVADFDGDGRMDVALSCGSFLRVYLQTAPGIFALERPGFNGAAGMGSTDLNGDGRAELVLVGTAPGTDIGSYQAWHAITRGPGGLWLALSTVPHGGDFAFPFGAVFADLDEDGQEDLVWVRKYSDGRHELAWALRQGSGFGTVRSHPITSGSGFFRDLAVGDVDGDGRSDVVATGFPADATVVAVMRGLAGGGFAPAQLYASAAGAFGIAVADINSDGRGDVLVHHEGGSLGVYLQGASGSLEPERLFETIGRDIFDGRSLLVADVDGDGRRDVVDQGDVLAGRPFGRAWPERSSDRAVAQSRLDNAILHWTRAMAARTKGLRPGTSDSKRAE
jgi:FG-GAP-like repeat/Bacterial Ig-like domain